jgi:multidrug efflux system membrane fusion protein
MTRKRWVIAAIVIAGVALFVWLTSGRNRSPGVTAQQPNAQNARGTSGPPVPVITAPVAQRDAPIYLEGLGSVVAFNTVSVKSRVDGQLLTVAFVEGQEVRKGDLLAQIDARPFEIQARQAEATLARDQALLAVARLTQARYLQLRKENLVAQDQVDTQNATVAQLEATTQGDRAQVDNAKLQLSYARITSPIDGRTGFRQIDAGNIIHANDPIGLVMITQLDPIAVLVTLPEDVLSAVLEEMAKHPLEADAFSRDGKDSLGVGKVALLDNQINATAGTLRLKAIFPNPKRALWPNQFVKVRVLLRVRKDAVVVPASVVQRGPDGAFAYVVKPDMTVEARPIQVATGAGEVAVVEKGLSAGEQVVTDGQYKLRAGSRVIPKPADKVAPAPGAGASANGSGAKANP